VRRVGYLPEVHSRVFYYIFSKIYNPSRTVAEPVKSGVNIEALHRTHF